MSDKPEKCSYGKCCPDEVTTKVSGKLGIPGGWYCTYHAGLQNGRILERSGGTVCCKPGSHRPGIKRKRLAPDSDERPQPLETEELPTTGFRGC